MFNSGYTLVTGGSGMLGSAMKKILPKAYYPLRKKYDLISGNDISEMMQYRPDYVIHLAARVGGLKANDSMGGDFFLENIYINTGILEYARLYEVKKAVSLLSTCVYPQSAKLPLIEEQIHDGIPHQSNFPYAYAKRMLDVQSRAYRKQYGCNFITAIPNNLFGENDNFDLDDSHVIPAIIRKIYEAKQNDTNVILWGTGEPLREFTYSEDVAKILVFLMEKYNEPHPINIGNTKEYSIKEVAYKIAGILEFPEKKIKWDDSKPNGIFRKPSSNQKLLDLGWNKDDYVDFDEALGRTVEWFCRNYPNVRGVK